MREARETPDPEHLLCPAAPVHMCGQGCGAQPSFIDR